MTFMGVKRENDQTCGDVFSALDPIAALGLLHHHRIKTTRTLVCFLLQPNTKKKNRRLLLLIFFFVCPIKVMVLVLDGAAVFIGWKVRFTEVTSVV